MMQAKSPEFTFKLAFSSNKRDSQYFGSNRPALRVGLARNHTSSLKPNIDLHLKSNELIFNEPSSKRLIQLLA